MSQKSKIAIALTSRVEFDVVILQSETETSGKPYEHDFREGLNLQILTISNHAWTFRYHGPQFGVAPLFVPVKVNEA
jgi:hypothetical protein